MAEYVDVNDFVEEMFGSGDDGMGTLDPAELDALAESGEMGAFIAKYATGMPLAQKQLLAQKVNSRMSANQKLMAQAAAVFFAKQATKPNAAATLAPALTGGTTMTAIPNATATPLIDISTNAPFVFQDGMVFYGITVDSADAEQGLFFAAGSVKFATDIAASFQSHVAFSSLAEDNLDPDRVPLGVYRGKKFRNTTQFNMSAIQFTGGPITMKQGVTVLYYDNRIRGACQCFGNEPQPSQFSPIAQALIQRVRARIPANGGQVTPDPLRMVW